MGYHSSSSNLRRFKDLNLKGVWVVLLLLVWKLDPSGEVARAKYILPGHDQHGGIFTLDGWMSLNFQSSSELLIIQDWAFTYY